MRHCQTTFNFLQFVMASFPVWVGSLPDHADEGFLEDLFTPFGSVRSTIIMRDEHSKSKCFGYVNFAEKRAAELSASNLNGRTVHGSRIKVKGPRELEKNYGQGTLSANAPQKMDYRPYTDCNFFLRGKDCNPKGKRVSL
jgi:RNA recognition motif-containing protein